MLTIGKIILLNVRTLNIPDFKPNSFILIENYDPFFPQTTNTTFYIEKDANSKFISLLDSLVRVHLFKCDVRQAQ